MKLILPIGVFFSLTTLLTAQNLPKFSGVMFGDFYFNLTQNNVDNEVLNGFQFRRIFITADYTISENFNSRFRLEADNIYNTKSTNSNKMNVWVKDAYLEWVNIFEVRACLLEFHQLQLLKSLHIFGIIVSSKKPFWITTV